MGYLITAAIACVCTLLALINLPKALRIIETAGQRSTSTEIVAPVASTLDEELARWVLSIGGRVTAMPPSDPYRARIVESPDQLPAERFFLTDVSLIGLQLQPGDLQKLTKLRHLSGLRLGASNVSDDDLTLITGLPLMRLELNDSDISDRGINNLGSLPNLEFLLLSNTSIGDSAVETICQRYKNIRELHLDGTQITDEATRYLPELTHLEVLNIESTMIGDVGAQRLEGNQSLRQLRRWNTRISLPEVERLFESLPNWEGRRPSMGSGPNDG